MDENKGTTIDAGPLVRDEQSSEEAAHAAEIAGADVALAVEAMLTAVTDRATAQALPETTSDSTVADGLSPQVAPGVGTGQQPLASDPIAESEISAAGAELPGPANETVTAVESASTEGLISIGAPGIVEDASAAAANVAASVEAMLAQTKDLSTQVSEALGGVTSPTEASLADDVPVPPQSIVPGAITAQAEVAGHQEDVTAAAANVSAPDASHRAFDISAMTENAGASADEAPARTTEMDDAAARPRETVVSNDLVGEFDESAPMSESEPPHADAALPLSDSERSESPPQVIPDALSEPPTESAAETTTQEPSETIPSTTHESAGAKSTSSRPVTDTLAQEDIAEPASKIPAEESFGEFENADDLLRQVQEQEEAAIRAKSGRPAASAVGSLTDLDAALAQDADKAVGVEDASEPSPVSAMPAPAAATPKIVPGTKPENRESPEPSPPRVATSESRARVVAVDAGLGSSDVRASTKKPGAAVVVRKIGRVIKPVPGIAMKVLVPVALRYERLGAEKHKLVKLVAIGTIVQAAAMWGYLMFGRTVDQAAIEAAANAKAGAVHPIAASLPGSHSADHGGHGHGASEASSAGHEPAEPSHAPAEKHEHADAHGEKTGHGH